jgi:hypothetical protein
MTREEEVTGIPLHRRQGTSNPFNYLGICISIIFSNQFPSPVVTDKWDNGWGGLCVAGSSGRDRICW